jgi:hypothetical protein
MLERRGHGTGSGLVELRKEFTLETDHAGMVKPQLEVGRGDRDPDPDDHQDDHDLDQRESSTIFHC